MKEKFNGKYRIGSHRLRGWDYSQNGYYYITINTSGRMCHFGDIQNGIMILNDFGKIAIDEWFLSFEMRKELFLGGFVLMPNHLHAIVIIDNDRLKTVKNDVGKTERDHHCRNVGDICRNVRPYVSTNITQSSVPHDNNKPKQNQKLPFERKPKSISSFVAGYKSAVLNKIDDFIDKHNLPISKFNRQNPLWQENYHDHIIRDKKSFERIANYIRKNPENWEG